MNKLLTALAFGAAVLFSPDAYSQTEMDYLSEDIAMLINNVERNFRLQRVCTTTDTSDIVKLSSDARGRAINDARSAVLSAEGSRERDWLLRKAIVHLNQALYWDHTLVSRTNCGAVPR